ncbi:geranylgeranylglycerol-phosphate geranylgeranyltransferase [uncultured Roseivirga sp.]|uniref:geranylgeranylglycerol-phosphate geranylgeranyltransferase n=1 Tax=uncultured Roseivirga sp. TaxID=543088 RepID=UPI0030DDA4BB|tara:strand:- start:201820 stop:202677 length:858 start_codon:yes stop_codon:yes gene_type:complete
MQVSTMSGPFSVFKYLKMVRGLNLIIVGLTQYFTAIFLLHKGFTWELLSDEKFFLLVLSTVVITSAGYLINDYYDVKIDYINRPDRVMVGKSLKRRWIIIGHTALNFLGIGIGFYVSPIIGIINFMAAFLLWLYSNQLKRLPFIGNLTIAILTGTTLFLVGQYFREREYLVLCYAIFAGFITLIREIIKDMEDLKGDERFGCKTLPIVFGIAQTKKIIYVISLVFCIVVFLLMISVNIVLPITLSVVMIFLIFELLKADKVKDYHRLSTFCKVIMLMGIISMVWI